jgi:hypothetical protein
MGRCGCVTVEERPILKRRVGDLAPLLVNPRLAFPWRVPFDFRGTERDSKLANSVGHNHLRFESLSSTFTIRVAIRELVLRNRETGSDPVDAKYHPWCLAFIFWWQKVL